MGRPFQRRPIHQVLTTRVRPLCSRTAPASRQEICARELCAFAVTELPEAVYELAKVRMLFLGAKGRRSLGFASAFALARDMARRRPPTGAAMNSRRLIGPPIVHVRLNRSLRATISSRRSMVARTLQGDGPSPIANATVFEPRGLNCELQSLVHQKA